MPLTDNFLQELKLKTDIEDVVSTYVTLKRRGATFVGLCPFHNEKTPSFTVYPETQSFYCFGCGAGGDAIGFIKQIENLDYIDAVKMLSQRAGLQMPEDGYDDTLGKKRRKILEINRESAKYFHSVLLSEEGKVGLNYYINRGLTKKTITKFGLGYAPDSWDSLLKHLKEQGFSIGDMLDAGVIKRSQKGSYYDVFRNKVMTPIIDVRGNVIGFGGRVLDNSKPKYINTNDTLVYKKTNELFGMNFAKDSGVDSLILCEGYMDVIAMYQAGITNAVGGCGTALTSEQVRLINRYANEVVLCYDNDEAGRKALNKAITLFEQTDIKIRIPALSGGKDPDEILKNQGVERFKAMLEGASNEIEYSLINIRSKYNVNTTQGKIDFINEAIKLLVKCSPVERDLYISRLSEELGIDRSSINAQLRQEERRYKSRQKKKAFENEISGIMRNNTRESYEKQATTRKLKAEERLLGLLIKYPNCAEAAKAVDENVFSDPFVKKVFGITLNILDNSTIPELMQYSQYLTDRELGRLSGIIASFSDSLHPEDEFKDCVAVINREYEDKLSSQTGNDLNDNDVFSNMLDKLKNKKNNT